MSLVVVFSDKLEERRPWLELVAIIMLFTPRGIFVGHKAACVGSFFVLVLAIVWKGFGSK